MNMKFTTYCISLASRTSTVRCTYYHRAKLSTLTFVDPLSYLIFFSLFINLNCYPEKTKHISFVEICLCIYNFSRIVLRRRCGDQISKSDTVSKVNLPHPNDHFNIGIIDIVQGLVTRSCMVQGLRINDVQNHTVSPRLTDCN